MVKSLLINNQVENAQLIELMSSKGGLVLNNLSIFDTFKNKCNTNRAGLNLCKYYL